MSEWASGTLGEFVLDSAGIKSGPFGTTLSAAEYTTVGVPVISVGEIGYGEFRVRDETPRVGPSTTERLSEYVLRAGDIVFGRKGAVDRSAWVSPAEDGWFLGSDGIRVRPNGRMHSRFLSFQLRAQQVRQWLLQHAGGSTLLSLNQPTLARVPVSVPPFAEQRAIAEVLGALDDKIAANTKLAATADQYMRTKFRSLDRQDAVPLSSTAQFVNGRAFTKGASGTGRVVIRIAELNSGVGGSTVFSDAVVDDKHVARPGDILFAWSGSLTLARWARNEAIVNQHIFKVIPNPEYPSWLVYELIRDKLDGFKAIAADKATTMGHIQRHHLHELVGVPSPSAIARLDTEMSAVWQRALLAEQENLTLAAIRDALLPHLMSGKLRVRAGTDEV